MPEAQGAGIPVSFLMGRPRGPDMTFVPERGRGQRWVSETGGGREEQRPRRPGRAGPRARAGPEPYVSCPQSRPAAARGRWGPGVNVCVLIVRERKQDSRCSKPKSRGEFDVRI